MRDVLVHVLDHTRHEPALTYAAALAARWRATLTAVNVPPGLPVPPMYDAAFALVEYASVQEELERARAAGPDVLAWASSLGVPHPRWVVSSGLPANVLRYMGHWHDLLVLGANPAEPWGTPGGLAELVLTAGVPCIVVPADCTADDPNCERVVIAWNGSAEAIRALHDALPLLERARRITVVAGEERKPDRPLPDFDLADWAARHQLEYELRRIAADADPAHVILSTAFAAEADLIVMGAYGRTRLAEWMLGGVTRELLHRSRVPLFMRH